ncbi:MAG TPA: hypothetical protein VFG91_06705 [Woeseiaceae bacterium]|nr:hypothetical protein [Woeseiaceae bacterium]
MLPGAIRKTLLSFVLVLPLALIACSDKPQDGLTSEEGILRYVPAETPYVFAATKRIPDDVREKLGASTGEVMQAYRKLVQAAIEQAPEDGGQAGLNADARQRFAAIIDEVAGMITPEGIPAAGIDKNSVAAFYGVGLLPVFRVTLSDGALFNETFAKLEERAGEAMDVATIDGHSYRYAGDDNGRFIVAVIDDQLVATFVPARLPDDLLKSVLGLTLPATSIADSGALAKLAETYGYLEYGLGMLDIERIAAAFLDEQSGINQWLLEATEHDTKALTDVCKTEIRAMAGIVPRVVAGYTELSTENIRTKSVFELRPDLAAGLQKITAPVPGLGQEQGGLFSFGMSLDMAAAREFYAARLDAMEADPYECELFADLQAGVAKGRAALQQPLPPVVYGIRGFVTVIDDIQGLDIEKKQPPTKIDMRFLLATDNAQGLLAMGAMFSPEIASLNLQPDSKPVKLDIPALASTVDAAYIAMSEDALALSVGSGSETRLTDMLNATSAQPPPFMSMDMDAGRYYGFLGDAIASNTAKPDDAGAAEGPSPEMLQATGDMMESFEKLFSRVSFEIKFTERGIEIPSSMSLAE